MPMTYKINIHCGLTTLNVGLSIFLVIQKSYFYKKGDQEQLKLYLQKVLFVFSVFYLFWERERAWEVGTAEKEEEKESQAGSALSAQSPMQGSNPQTMRLWPEPKSRAEHLKDWAIQVTLQEVLFNDVYPNSSVLLPT